MIIITIISSELNSDKLHFNIYVLVAIREKANVAKDIQKSMMQYLPLADISIKKSSNLRAKNKINVDVSVAKT